jgi:hypothetical protein
MSESTTQTSKENATKRPERVVHPPEYYEQIKQRFAEARDLRLSYRPEGRNQFVTELEGELARYETDPYAVETIDRAPINDTVEVLFIGGGFSALLTSARLREVGVESIRIVERGADVGGTWYWNRYPGVACDVVAYDYLPLLDELQYVATAKPLPTSTTSTNSPFFKPPSRRPPGSRTSRCGMSVLIGAT